jgi:hypothetical protein
MRNRTEPPSTSTLLKASLAPPSSMLVAEALKAVERSDFPLDLRDFVSAPLESDGGDSQWHAENQEQGWIED